MTQQTAWIVGATGLVGREALQLLLNSQAYARVVAYVRRPSGSSHPKLEERVVDFEKLDAAFDARHCDVALCCLGTTIKVAGSQAQFRRVDYEYPLAFARAARARGARSLGVVSAMGASARSSIFYNRVKGELEEALAKLDYASLSIARPSLLLGERSELRLGEKVFAPFSKLLPARYRGIEAKVVAKALVKLATDSAPGKRIALNDELLQLGKS